MVIMHTILTISALTLSLLIGLIIFLSVKKARGTQIPTAVLLLLLCFTAINAAVTYFIYPREDINAYKQLVWQPLVAKEIPALVKQGNTVFVDVSADWCIICKGNKDRVLHREAVVKLLKRNDMVLMLGDLTQSDPVIEAFLAQHNAYGIPFTILFSPQYPQGIALSRVLDYHEVLTLLRAH